MDFNTEIIEAENKMIYRFYNGVRLSTWIKDGQAFIWIEYEDSKKGDIPPFYAEHSDTGFKFDGFFEFLMYFKMARSL